MTRLNLVLLAALMASALYLVRTQYEARRLFGEIERATATARRLELENQALEIQRRAQATPSRIEKLAKDRLAMRAASPAITEYVAYQAEAGGATTNPASTGKAAGARP
jgi:cell division protein FtsL